MKSYYALTKNGYRPIFWSNFCIGDRLTGCCSAQTGKTNLYKAACILIEDNDIDEDDLNAMIITKEEFKEIAQSCDTFYTNFGIDIHTHDLKTQKPYCNCKVIKISIDEIIKPKQ